jgi:secondary thiamine-phosphate synthase enzyme
VFDEEGQMSVLAPRGRDREAVWTARDARLVVRTAQPTEIVEITGRVQSAVVEVGLITGTVSVQTLHTTTALVLNENEPLLHQDLESMLERLAPTRSYYRHDDLRIRTVNVGPAERPNGHAHCRAAMLGNAALLHVVRGEIVLGRWQRLLFVELDGPQDRTLSVMASGLATGDPPCA